MRSAGVGLSELHCKYHVQHLARHGSHWCPTYKAGDLKPYLQAASRLIKQHRATTPIAHALIALQGLLDSAGRALPAQDLKRRTAAVRARVAFARLREASIKAERLLAIHMAVSALIRDDAGSHRVSEFRIVQVAKAAHRLASGTHKRWDFPLKDGSTAPLTMHVYPNSAGRVLRAIGEAIEEICRDVTEASLEELRAMKLAQSGPHPSQDPASGWRPHWARKRDAAKK